MYKLCIKPSLLKKIMEMPCFLARRSIVLKTQDLELINKIIDYFDRIFGKIYQNWGGGDVSTFKFYN